MIQTSKKIKFIAWIALAVFFLVTMFFVISNLVATGNMKNKKRELSLAEIQQQYEKASENLFIVSGEFVCLPFKNENVPHNDLCAFGIKNGNGDYYRLQAMSDNKFNLISAINKGQKIEISGEFINEDSDTYKTLGTINVLGVKYLESEAEDLESNLPESLKADYISFSDYSANRFAAEEYPKLESWAENGEIECTATSQELSLPLRISKREINGQKYCVAAASEGAVGSVYTQYSYSTVIDNNIYIINFVARYVNCSNYPEIEAARCQAERESFNLDLLVSEEVKTMLK